MNAHIALSRRGLLGAGAGAAALVVAACGGDDSSETEQSSPQSGAAQATPAGGPKRGGTLVEAANQYTTDLDAHATPTPATFLTGRIFNSLLQLRMLPDASGFEVKPDIAASYEQPDQQTYVFKITPDIKTHNRPPTNGSVFTAEDVVASLNLMAKPPQNVAARFIRTFNFENLESINAVDQGTVRIRFGKPFAPFLTYIADPFNLLYPKEVIDKYGPVIEDQAGLVGTGPFMLDSYTPRVRSKVVRNPDYFRQGTPYLDAIESAIIEDVSTRIASLRSGAVEKLSGLTKDQVEDVQRTNRNLQTGATPQLSGVCFMFNLAKDPVKDPRIRQAIDLAFDRTEMILLLLGGDGDITGAPIPPGLGQFSLNRKELEQAYGKNLARSQSLLREAGVTTPLRVPFMGATLFTNQHAVLKAQLEKAGIILDPFEQIEYAAFTQRRIQKDFVTSFFGRAQYSDPEEFLYKDFHTTGGSRNYYNYSNPQVDALLDRQRALSNPTERAKVLEEAQRIIMNDRPLLSLYVGTNRFLWHPRMQGFAPNNLRSDDHTFDTVWLNG